jgi:enoyl-CoA hydratase/carnithine racemase
MNAEILKLRQKEADEAAALDLKIVTECLEQDELERKAKSAKRGLLKKEMHAYREHLLEQKRIEDEREKEIEAMYKFEDEKVFSTF